MPGAKNYSIEIRKFYNTLTGVTGITDDHLAICANKSNTFIFKKNDTEYANILAHDVTALGQLAVSGESHLMDDVYVYPKAFITSPRGNFNNRNEAFGKEALDKLPNENNAVDNIAVGYYTMYEITGSDTSMNIAIGNRSLSLTGSFVVQNNIVVGHYSSSNYINSITSSGASFSVQKSIVLGSSSLYVNNNGYKPYLINDFILLGHNSANSLINTIPSSASSNTVNTVLKSIVIGNGSSQNFIGNNNLVFGHNSFNLFTPSPNLIAYNDNKNIILGNDILTNKYYKYSQQNPNEVYNNVNNTIIGFLVKRSSTSAANIKTNLVNNVLIVDDFLNSDNNDEKTELYNNIIICKDSFQSVKNTNDASYFGANVVLGTSLFNNIPNINFLSNNVIIGQNNISSSLPNLSASYVSKIYILGSSNTVNITSFNNFNSIIAIGYKAYGYVSENSDNNDVGSRQNNISIGFFNQKVILSGAKNNISIGNNILNQNTTGSNNIGVGESALTQIIGEYNIGIGYKVLDTASGTDIKENIVIGFESLQKNIKKSNIAIGAKVLRNNTIGENNICLGIYSMVNSASGSFNVCLGSNNMINVSGNNNISIGDNIMAQSDTNPVDGWANIGIGTNSLNSITGGSNNIAIGAYCLQKYKFSQTNIAIGLNALAGSDSSSSKSITSNIAIGVNTAKDISGSNNIAIGASALTKTQGINNIAIGDDAGIELNPSSSGCGYNIILGYKSAAYAKFSYRNIVIGTECASSNNAGGENNIILGKDTATELNANNNIVLGYAAGNKVKTHYNIILGYEAVNTSQLSNDKNICIGYQNSKDANWGSDNISIGSQSSINASGSYQIIIGASAGKNVKSSGNIVIGYEAVNNSQVSNGGSNICIGYQNSTNANWGWNNISIGSNSSISAVGNNHIVIGKEAGSSISGNNNIIFGTDAGKNIKSSENITIGSKALKNSQIPNGGYNICIGYKNSSNCNFKWSNISIGTEATTGCDGDYNIVIGYRSGTNISGSHNNIIGSESATNTLNLSYIQVLGDKNISSLTANSNNISGNYFSIIGYNNLNFDVYNNNRWITKSFIAGVDNFSSKEGNKKVYCEEISESTIIGYNNFTTETSANNFDKRKIKLTNSFVFGNNNFIDSTGTTGGTNTVKKCIVIGNDNIKKFDFYNTVENNLIIGNDIAKHSGDSEKYPAINKLKNNIFLGFDIVRTPLTSSSDAENLIYIGAKISSGYNSIDQPHKNSIILSHNAAQYISQIQNSIFISSNSSDSSGYVQTLNKSVIIGYLVGSKYSVDDVYLGSNNFSGQYSSSIINDSSTTLYNVCVGSNNFNVGNNYKTLNMYYNILIGSYNGYSKCVYSSTQILSGAQNNIIIGNHNYENANFITYHSSPGNPAPKYSDENIILGNFNVYNGITTRKEYDKVSNIILGNRNFYPTVGNYNSNVAVSGGYDNIVIGNRILSPQDQNQQIIFSGNSNIIIGNDIFLNDFWNGNPPSTGGEVSASNCVFIKVTNQLPIDSSSTVYNLKINDKYEVFKQTSSRKFKTNIEPMWESEILKVYDLQPVYYKLKDKNGNPSKISYYGFIAEEVAEVEPRLAGWSYDDDEDYEYVDQDVINKEEKIFNEKDKLIIYFNNEEVKTIIFKNNQFYINKNYLNINNITGNEIFENNNINGSENIETSYRKYYVIDNIEYYALHQDDLDSINSQIISKIEYIKNELNNVNKISINNVTSLKIKNNHIVEIYYKNTYKIKKLKENAKLKPISVHYEYITAHLVGVVKIQKRKIEELENKVQHLENEINLLKNQISAIIQTRKNRKSKKLGNNQ